MLVQDKSFTWNLGGTGHNLELLLLSLWMDWLCCSPFYPAPHFSAQQSKLAADCRRNSLYEGSETCSKAASSDKLEL